MQLPYLDQETVEVQPLPIRRFPNGLSDAGIGVDVKELVRTVDCDLLEISMFGCDSFECRGDPCDNRRRGQKNCISEFCRFREVDRCLAKVDYGRR